MKYFLLFSCLLFSQICFSQNIKKTAVIYLNDGTPLNGIMKYGDWESTPDVVKFKRDSTNEYITYLPESISSFTVNDEVYISREVLIDRTYTKLDDLPAELLYDTVRKRVFLRQVTSGKKSLYAYITQQGDPNFYIHTEDDSLHLLVYKKYIGNGNLLVEISKYFGQLNYHLSDCNIIAKKIESTKYNEASMKKLFLLYNDCGNGANTKPVKTIKPKYTLDILGGLTYTKINFVGSNQLLFSGGDFNPFLSYSFWLSFAVPVQRKFQSRNLMAELGIRNINIKGKDSLAGGFGARYEADVNLSYTYLKTNLLYRNYIVTKKKFVPFVEVGLSLALAAIRVDGYIHNLTNGFSYDKNQLKSSDATVFLGVGACYNDKFLFTVRYDHGNLLSSARVKTIYFLLGYRIF